MENRGKGTRRRTGYPYSIGVELASVTRTSNDTLIRFPVRDTSQMRANRRQSIEISLFRADNEDFLIYIQCHATGRIVFWFASFELHGRFPDNIRG